MGLPRSIAIDGPVAAGKSVIGKLLADRLHYLYLDTGAMYRAVTWLALERDVPLDDEPALTIVAQRIDLRIEPGNGPLNGRAYTVLVGGRDVTAELRSAGVERAVSAVSRVAGVREEMVRRQREYGQRGAVVMVGRDIGTVVLPDADLKLYLLADVRERARRRYLELGVKGEQRSLESVLEDLERRDQIDSTRAVGPLRPATDAIQIVTDRLTIDEVVERIQEIVDERRCVPGRD